MDEGPGRCGEPKGRISGLPIAFVEVLSGPGANRGRGLGGTGGGPKGTEGGDPSSAGSVGVIRTGGTSKDGPGTGSNEVLGSFIDGVCSLSDREETVGEISGGSGGSVFRPRLRPDTRPMRSV